MKTLHLRVFGLFILALFFCISCKKDDANPQLEISKKENIKELSIGDAYLIKIREDVSDKSSERTARKKSISHHNLGCKLAPSANYKSIPVANKPSYVPSMLASFHRSKFLTWTPNFL